MSEAVYLFLKANGSAIDGESSQVSLGRENSIECYYFDHAVSMAREAGSGMATGRHTHAPVIIRKRIDKSTPLLLHALIQNQVIEGEFRFYRPNPTGDGTTQHFYTVTIGKGRISSVRQVAQHPTDFLEGVSAPVEEIQFIFQTITWRYEDGSVEATDDIRAR